MNHRYPIPPSLREEVNKKIEVLRQHTEMHFKVCIPEFEIRYDLFGLSTLGQASYRLRIMRLHSPLLIEYTHIYINDVVVHEFAHFVVAHLYQSGKNAEGKKVTAHGNEFKQVCAVLGIEGKATTALYSDAKSLLEIAKLREQQKKTESSASSRDYFLGELDISVSWTRHIYLDFTDIQKTMLLYQLRQVVATVDTCIYYDNEPFSASELRDLMLAIEDADMINVAYGNVLISELSNISETLYMLGDSITAYVMIDAMKNIAKTQE